MAPNSIFSVSQLCVKIPTGALTLKHWFPAWQGSHPRSSAGSASCPFNTRVLDGPSLPGVLCSPGSGEHLPLTLTRPAKSIALMANLPPTHTQLLPPQPSASLSVTGFTPLASLDYSSWPPTLTPNGINTFSPTIAPICPHSHG